MVPSAPETEGIGRLMLEFYSNFIMIAQLEGRPREPRQRFVILKEHE